MIKIYKGVIRLAKVTKIVVKDGIPKQFEYVRPIINNNALFYQGVRSKPISFDHNTVIPDEAEATEMLKLDIKTRQEPDKKPYPKCMYINYNEIKPYMMVTRKQFKKMKKEYKDAEKAREQETKKRSR